MAQRRRKKVAIVQCQADNCRKKSEARIEMQVCKWGCTGCESCVQACRLNAVRINARGTAEVIPEKCVGCGLCTKACPRRLIRVVNVEYNIYSACVNEDPGAQTRKLCDHGCIACKICVKNCPMGAIDIVNNHAVIDEEKCIACGMCAVKCPRGVILDNNGIFTVRKEQVVG